MVDALLAQKNPNMVDVLLVHKKSRYGCCPADIFNSLDMVDVLPVHKKSRHGYCSDSIFKIKRKWEPRHSCRHEGVFIKTCTKER